MASKTMNENDSGKQQRLDFIQKTLKDEVGIIPVEIHPVAYEDDFPFPYNNFVYRVKFEPGASYGGQQPGTCHISQSVSECIVRLPNATSGYNNRVRVENEVAALAMAREAFQSRFPDLVPRVFAWGSANSQQGWMLQELMPGSPLMDDFNEMPDVQKVVILKQMAEILAELQRYKFPATVQHFGGLQFGPSGEFMSGPISIMDAGPFATYADLVRATIESKLSKADTDPQVKGWRANGIRARLDKFMETGFPKILEDMGTWPMVLVHSDLTADNLLYDKETMRVTALLDFDFTHVATFCDEFFRSLGSRIGRFPSKRGPNDMSLLRKAMLTGFADPLPEKSEDVDWPSAKAWDDALADVAAAKPSSIKNIAPLSDLFWLSGEILPFKLCNKVVVANSSHEQLQKWKAEGETSLLKFLNDYDY